MAQTGESRCLLPAAFTSKRTRKKRRRSCGVRSFVNVPVFRVGCRNRQAASCSVHTRWLRLPNLSGASPTRQKSWRAKRRCSLEIGRLAPTDSAQGSQKEFLVDGRCSGSSNLPPFTGRRRKRSRLARFSEAPAAEARRAVSVTEHQRSALKTAGRGKCGFPSRDSGPKRALQVS